MNLRDLAVIFFFSGLPTHDTVSAGLVTGVKAGTATITASCAGYTASCSVTVKSKALQVTNTKWGYLYGKQKGEIPYKNSLYAFDEGNMFTVDAQPSRQGQFAIYFETKDAINTSSLSMQIKNLVLTPSCASDGGIATDRSRLVDNVRVCIVPGDYVINSPPIPLLTKQASFSLKDIPSNRITSADMGKTAIVNCGDINTTTISIDPSVKGFTILIIIEKGSNTSYNSACGYGQIPWSDILINGKPLEYVDG